MGFPIALEKEQSLILLLSSNVIRRILTHITKLSVISGGWKNYKQDGFDNIQAYIIAPDFNINKKKIDANILKRSNSIQSRVKISADSGSE
jgi:hypothetical protein